MKQTFKFVAAIVAAAAMSASCEKPYEQLDPQFPTIPDGQSVTISSGQTVTVGFSLNDVRGNVIKSDIAFQANEDYNVSCSFNEGNESGAISITAPTLILDGTAFDIDVTFTDEVNNRTSSKTINVVPAIIDGFVKIADGANTFIVSSGAYVQFPTLKGNSGQKSGATTLALAWQDTKGLFSDIVKVNDGEAIVHFAAGKEGNAYINGLDKDGKVVWSWLFWVVDNAPKDVNVGGYAFMDRNVGAINLDEKSELSSGLVYQYGRKDPFPGLQFTKYAMREIYNAKGEAITITTALNDKENNIEGSIANPTVYYYQKYVSGQKHNYNWVTTNAITFGEENFKSLWANSKTMYDPCPAGYKIAPMAAWAEVAKASSVQEIWDTAFETWDDTAIGTNERYAAGNRKKVQFRGCVYDGLRLTVTGEINANTSSGALSFANCVGKALPTAEVWCSDVEPNYATATTDANKVTYFRGTAVKVNTSGNGNYDDVSAIKVNSLSTGGRYGLHYSLPVRCIREK